MPHQHDLSVPYHQQDTDYYCGAASAQMVLDSIGAGLLDQDNLYNDCHSHSTTEAGWYTAPDGLRWTLNHRKPPSFGNHFVLFSPKSEETISRKIIWTIHHYKVAPVALVYGSDHWIVVRGYRASHSPADSMDTSYSIDGFMVNNPWPPTPSWSDPSLAPPPPHRKHDGCGTGGNRGVVNEHLSYTVWQDTYMTGVPGGHWAGEYVAVCDPDPLPEGVGPSAERRPLRDRLLSAEEATELSLEGLREHGLLELESYNQALSNSELGQPLLVQRLDRTDTFYYIIPWIRGTSARLAVLLDGRSGEYLQSAVHTEEEGSVFHANDPAAIREQVVGKRIDLPDKGGRFIVRPETFSQSPVLGWRPCKESLSPLYPFHLLAAGTQPLFMRVDGAIFTALHDADRGV